MSQTKLQSFIEAWANVAVGYLVALVTQLTVFPLYGMKVSFGDNVQIGIIFTGISLLRSYTLRRWFNKKTVAKRI